MDDSADDEAGLVIRGRNGDRAAFERLVRNTARGLFARIYLDTADAHWAEDLVQETFLRAWTKLPSLSDPKTFRGWLNAIAHSVVVDSHKHDVRRKRGRAETKTDEQSMLRLADISAGPEEWAQQSEQRLAAVEALRSLPQEYQDVLSLRYLTGADYREIGKQLAISNGSLRGLLGRGLKMLREKLKDSRQQGARETTMTEHEWFNEQIATYLADGLEAAERARFDEHAQGCAACAAELANARELEARISSAFAGMIPADFENRLLARLSSTLSRVEGQFSTPKRRLWIHPVVRKSAIAAAAAIVVSGFGYIGKEYIERGELPVVALNAGASQDGDEVLGNTMSPPPGLIAADNRIYRFPLKKSSAYNTEAIANLIFTGTGGINRGVMTGQTLGTRARSDADAGKTFGGLSADTKSAVSNLKSQVQVVADTNTNSLLVTANPKDWPAVRKTLDELDKSQAVQTLATVNGNKQLGQAMQIQGGTLTGVAQIKGLASPLTTVPHAGSLKTNEVAHVATSDSSVASSSGEGLWRFDFRNMHATSDDWATASTWKPNESAKSDTFFKLDKVTMDDTAKAGGNLLRLGGDNSNFSGQLSVNAGTLELPGHYRPLVAPAQFALKNNSGNGYTVAGSGTLSLPGDASSSATITTGITTSSGYPGSLTVNNGTAEIAETTVNLGREVALLQEARSNSRNESPTTQPTSTGASAPQLSIRKVIREGVMEFEVDSFDSTFIQLSKIAAEEGGFISAADSDKLPNGKVKGSVTVRVPPDHLDTLVLKLRALGELKTQRLGSRDVGKEYTDLEGQLRAARAMEERLLEMIKNANGKVAELLQAERELGTWRTKIETITGQLNYFNNLISMATLTVNAYEKDIRTPASASQTEEINTGIETDDVESARAAAIKSIDDVKGRIVESTLQKLEAGQFAAKIVAEVAPENAGQVVDRLKQLGRMARLDIQRRQTTDTAKPQAGVQAPIKIEQAPTKLIISMYNLANVAPRLTTNLNLAGDDVESIYRAILKRVTDAGGRVVVSNLNRQDATNVTGSIQFEVKSGDSDAVLNDIRKDVQVLRLSVNENPDTANVTTAKQAFTVQVIPTAQVPPRQTRSLSVQISDVEVGMQSINSALGGFGARLSDSNLAQDADGRSVARLGIDVPLGKVEQLLDVARKLGKVRVSESSENPQVPEGPLARARINLVLGSGETIIPAQGGFWSSIREGLSTSVKGLMWSLELIVIGLCLVGPWVGLVWGGWRFFKRRKQTAP